MFTTGLEFAVDGWNSIKDYQVGIVRGVGSSEAGTKGMANVHRATSLEDLVRMLDRDRFDLLVTDLFSGGSRSSGKTSTHASTRSCRRWNGSTSITISMSGTARWCRAWRR